MSYYGMRPAGDYRTYGYAGDPGFLSSLWKGFKKVAKFIPGPIGTIARIAGIAGAGIAATKVLGPVYPAPPTTGGFPLSPAGQVTRFAPGRAATYGQPPMFLPPMAGQPGVAPGGACPTGYHLAKDGSGRMVRNRRMNVANPRALRKAMRRVSGFEKLAKRTIQFTRRVRPKKRAS